MPFVPEADLKRPDLKGEFFCGTCNRKYHHAASLNRHRLNVHGDNQTCTLCNKKLLQNDTASRHMRIEHQITKVFTCGCCNWTFADKKQLISHSQSMASTGQPGEAIAIAVSDCKPGSYSQHEIRGEERPTPSPRARKQKPALPVTLPADSDNVLSEFLKSANLENLFPQNPVEAQEDPLAISTNQFLLDNIAMLLQANSPSSSSDMEAPKTPEDFTFEDLLSEADKMNMNDGKDERASSLPYSGQDSGIGSTEMSHIPTPVSTPPLPTSSSEVSPTTAPKLLINKAKSSNKRGSIDDICAILSKKKAANI